MNKNTLNLLASAIEKLSQVVVLHAPKDVYVKLDVLPTISRFDLTRINLTTDHDVCAALGTEVLLMLGQTKPYVRAKVGHRKMRHADLGRWILEQAKA